MNKLINFRNKTLDFIYKYRFIIAIVCLIIGVLFKLHGSSIGLWNGVYKTGLEDNHSLLFGKLRGIRSDEWAVTTPFIFSQSFNGFEWFSELLRGGTLTDAFSLYGLPVLNIATIFRPFHLGYLLFGIEYGLSFFWIAKFIALFVITFEFIMLLTNKNKRLSVIGAFMISLAPMIQWCFATNGTVDLFVFGELAILLLHKYMNTENFKLRLGLLFLMVVCAGSYILILYPAFQIPMFYVFLAIAIYIIIDNRKNCKIKLKDILSIVFFVLVFVGLLAYIIITSWNSIQATLNTVYPGARIDTGGTGFRKVFSYFHNLLLPYKELGIVTHPEEEAAFIGLFPLGIISSIYAMVKNKKKDLLSIVIYIPYIILFTFCVLGFPEFLAKITLLSMSFSSRVVLALGFMDVLLLVRAISITKEPMKLWISLIVSIILSGLITVLCHYMNPNYVGIYSCILLFGIFAGLFFFALQYNTKYGKYIFTLGIIGTMFISGFTVNPIVQGTDMITESPLLNSVKEIHEQDEGLWLVDAIGFPGPNYFVMGGIPVVNSTSAYPNLEFCKKFDPEGKYEEVYNRYAHIYIEVVADESQIAERFVLMGPDKYYLYITPEELKEMNIKYIFTVRDMSLFKTETVDYDFIYNDENNHHIYKVQYKD